MREIKFHLEDLLDAMRVPEERKNLNISTNIRWLKNNLALANSNHEYFDEAIYLITILCKKLRI